MVEKPLVQDFETVIYNEKSYLNRNDPIKPVAKKDLRSITTYC